jgi:phosphoserine phosphatase
MHLKLNDRVCDRIEGTRVILVRHGESTYNALGLYQGCSDESVLTENGRRAARQTGAFLSGLSFDAIYTSSLKRAQETAREILSVMAPTVDVKTIHVVEQLRETHLPAWEGLPFKDVKKYFAADYRCWKQRPHEFRMELPQAKTQISNSSYPCFSLYFYPALDLCDRVQQFWQEVLPRHVGQTLLLVTHGGTNRGLISTAMGLKPDYYHAMEQSNCGISVLHFPTDTTQPAQLEALNLTSHVASTLPKLKDASQGLRLLLLPSGETNPKSAHNLAQFLKDTTINFSISGYFDNSQATVEQILQYHPEAVQLEVLEEELLDVLQQAIDTKNSVAKLVVDKSSQLVTGAVFAPNSIIKIVIGSVLGMTSEQLCQLQLKTGAISCIYYPSYEHHPILQAMNVSDSEKDLIFGSVVAGNQLF